MSPAEEHKAARADYDARVPGYYGVVCRGLDGAFAGVTVYLVKADDDRVWWCVWFDQCFPATAWRMARRRFKRLRRCAE